MQFQSPIIMRQLAVGVHILSSPGPVGQDWPLLPEGAQPLYDDHDSLQDAKVSCHTAVNTKVSQPIPRDSKLVVLYVLLIQMQVLY